MSGKFNIVNFDDTTELDNETENLYELTEYQAFLLLTQTEYLGWKTRWDNLPENTDIVAIRDLLNYKLMTPLNGDGVIVTTPTDLCEAVECGVLKVFSRALSGSAGNIGTGVTLDDSGIPVLIDGALSGGGSGSQSSALDKMGAMEYTELRIEEYIQDYADFYTSESGDSATIIAFLSAKYIVNDNITSAVDDYVIHRQAMNPAPVPGMDGLDRQMYCFGATQQEVSSWVIDDALGDKTLRLSMISAITQEQFDTWYNQSNLISDDYQNTPCFTYQPVTFNVEASQWNQNGGNIAFDSRAFLKTNRRYKLDVTGVYTRGNGDKWDAMYNEVSDVFDYNPVQLVQSNGATPKFPISQPTLSQNGYTVIFDNGLSTTLHANLSPISEYTGTFTFKFTDYGSTL